MDAGGQKFFPNLKISIDKTKSSSEEDETSDLDSKYDIDKVSMKLDCPSDGEMRDDKNEDDVRYNVRIGKFTESFPGHNYDGNVMKSSNVIKHRDMKFLIYFICCAIMLI